MQIRPTYIERVYMAAIYVVRVSLMNTSNNLISTCWFDLPSHESISCFLLKSSTEISDIRLSQTIRIVCMYINYMCMIKNIHLRKSCHLTEM